MISGWRPPVAREPSLAPAELGELGLGELGELGEPGRNLGELTRGRAGPATWASPASTPATASWASTRRRVSSGRAATSRYGSGGVTFTPAFLQYSSNPARSNCNVHSSLTLVSPPRAVSRKTFL